MTENIAEKSEALLSRIPCRGDTRNKRKPLRLAYRNGRDLLIIEQVLEWLDLSEIVVVKILANLRSLTDLAGSDRAHGGIRLS